MGDEQSRILLRRHAPRERIELSNRVRKRRSGRCPETVAQEFEQSVVSQGRTAGSAHFTHAWRKQGQRFTLPQQAFAGLECAGTDRLSQLGSTCSVQTAWLAAPPDDHDPGLTRDGMQQRSIVRVDQYDRAVHCYGVGMVTQQPVQFTQHDMRHICVQNCNAECCSNLDHADRSANRRRVYMTDEKSRSVIRQLHHIVDIATGRLSRATMHGNLQSRPIRQ